MDKIGTNKFNEKEEKKIEEKTLKTKKDQKEQKEKNDTPVIIRREVIINDSEMIKKQEVNKKVNTPQREIGFVENERKKDYNIVYRNKPNKPLTASELFGKKEEPKKPTETIEKEEIKKDDDKQEIKPNPIIPNKPAYNNQNAGGSRPPYNNNNQSKPPYNNQNRPTYNNNQSTGTNNTNRPYNNNNQSRPPYNNNQSTGTNQSRPYNNQNAGGSRPYNNNNQSRPYNNNGFNRGPRALDDKGIEKNIKNIMSVDIEEKQNVREYASRAIDKQKSTKYEENKVNKKATKTRKSDYEDVSSKLKDLKQENGLSNMFTEGSMLDYYDLTTIRGRRSRKRINQDEERVKQKIFKLKEIQIPDNITVKDLSLELKKTSSEIIKKLLGYGIFATINNEVDFDTAFLIAGEFGITAQKKEVLTDEDILFDDSEDNDEDMITRPPVIVVMGHVDHR